jgi:hypothetical protein
MDPTPHPPSADGYGLAAAGPDGMGYDVRDRTEAAVLAEAKIVREIRQRRLLHQLDRLGQVADMAVEMASALTDQARERKHDAETAGIAEVALAFTRVTRAIRQINAQEQIILDLLEKVQEETATDRRYAADLTSWDRKDDGRRHVTHAVRGLLSDLEEPKERERLMRDVANDYDDLYDLYEGSTDAIIAHICRDLKIAVPPDLMANDNRELGELGLDRAERPLRRAHDPP